MFELTSHLGVISDWWEDNPGKDLCIRLRDQADWQALQHLASHFQQLARLAKKWPPDPLHFRLFGHPGFASVNQHPKEDRLFGLREMMYNCYPPWIITLELKGRGKAGFLERVRVHIADINSERQVPSIWRTIADDGKVITFERVETCYHDDDPRPPGFTIWE